VEVLRALVALGCLLGWRQTCHMLQRMLLRQLLLGVVGLAGRWMTGP
jgi:hypothetical protein